MLEHAKEDGRVVALEIFRSMIVGNSERVIALSADVVYKLVSKSTWKLRGDQTWSSYKWREMECGFRLASVLVKLGVVAVERYEEEYTALLNLLRVNKAAHVKSAALRLLIVAARQGQVSVGFLDILAKNIAEKSNIVHTFSAVCVKDVLIATRKKGGEVSGFDALALVVSLFKALKHPDSDQNEHLMSCIFHVLDASHLSYEVYEIGFIELLRQISMNPQNQYFKKHVSSSFTVLLRKLHKMNARLLLPKVIKEDMLGQILCALEELVSVEQEQVGLNALQTIIQHLRYDVIAAYTDNVWTSLFARFFDKVKTGFALPLVLFLSHFLLSHGAKNLEDSLHHYMGPNCFDAVLKDVWIPSMKLIKGRSMELDVIAAATTELLCHNDGLLEERLWGEMLDGILTVFNEHGFTAGKEDPMYVLCSSLNELSCDDDSPDKYIEVANEFLSPGNYVYLQECYEAYYKFKSIQNKGQ